MTDLYRELDQKEREEFRAWARQNFQPGDEINPLWHPVVREECKDINFHIIVEFNSDQFIEVQKLLSRYLVPTTYRWRSPKSFATRALTNARFIANYLQDNGVEAQVKKEEHE